MDPFDILAAKIDAEEKEEMEKASRLSFTKEKMTAHLKDEDHTNPILKGHLYLEHILTTAIQDALRFPNEMNVRLLGFPTKLNLALALGQFPKDLRATAAMVSELRNKLAHRLDFGFDQKDHDKLWNSLPPNLRDAVAEFVRERAVEGKDITIQHMMVALIMSAEYFGVARAKERVQEVMGMKHLKPALKLAEPGMRANGLI